MKICQKKLQRKENLLVHQILRVKIKHLLLLYRQKNKMVKLYRQKRQQRHLCQISQGLRSLFREQSQFLFCGLRRAEGEPEAQNRDHRKGRGAYEQRTVERDHQRAHTASEALERDRTRSAKGLR